MTSRFAIERNLSTREVNGGNVYVVLNRELVPLVRALRDRANLGELAPGGYQVDQDYTVLDVLSDLENESVVVSSDKNVLNVLSSSSSTEPELTVTGDDNVITVQTPTKSLVVMGNNNRFFGAVLSVTNTGAGNDFTGLKGARGRGVSTQTTDASGRMVITIPAVPGGLSVAATANVLGAAPADAYVRVNAVSSTALELEVRKDDGTAYALTSVSVSYLYECY